MPAISTLYPVEGRAGALEIERVPAREERIDLETQGNSSTSFSVLVSICGMLTGSCFW